MRYRFREGTNRPAGQHVGLLAQDVQAVFPELVTEGADGYLSVAYGKLSALLLQGLHEQQATIAAQAQQIEALQAEVEALRQDTAARLAALEAALSARPHTPSPAASAKD